MISKHADQLARDERFEFGQNWQRFLKVVDKDRIAEAERSLKEMLDVEDLNGKSFLDVGSGSGLFSLAARRLGAKVHSFDYDRQSVACTAELKRQFCIGDANWIVEEGSVLDDVYMNTLNRFDIVYSWGVLHHTGNMKHALENVGLPVANRGKLCLAIYNDQGFKSQVWRMVKRFYCSSVIGKLVTIGIFFPYFFVCGFSADLFRIRNPLRRYKEYKRKRGMSVLTDWLDWLGGYPFEVAKPEQIFEFFNEKGYRLERLRAYGGGLGNNEYVFVKDEQVLTE
jgi:2-polyprenyl-6-hydroxyphenyl methylase/3-demethylubiquinone-9 3-methyltransferase